MWSVLHLGDPGDEGRLKLCTWDRAGNTLYDGSGGGLEADGGESQEVCVEVMGLTLEHRIEDWVVCELRGVGREGGTSLSPPAKGGLLTVWHANKTSVIMSPLHRCGQPRPTEERLQVTLARPRS